MRGIEGSTRRVRLEIDGTVQGVGFRPYVYRLAQSLQLSGFVRNDTRGVVVEVQGASTAVEQFIWRLPREAPPLASCECIRRAELAVVRDVTFRIVESDTSAPVAASVTPDAATCHDCLDELFNVSNRRYRYPFINCTNCGPRFTIVRGVPYDRSLTTMAGFSMCADCRAEYEDPVNRRFHAQPNACPACGPHARLLNATGVALPLGGAPDAIAAAANALRVGAILAVKGVGGYHLACLANDDRAVTRLRQGKHRGAKPFAIMVADAAVAMCLIDADLAEIAILTSHERPIVLARRRQDAEVAGDVAPRQRDLGVMLPYSPLHHLLLADVGAPLVMTSGNVSDEPIAFQDDDALYRLAPLVDAFLVHDRPIETRTDDSVVRTVTIGTTRQPMTLRRSRGYVPASLPLPVPAATPILACGGQLKNSFSLVRGARVWLGPHIGDLANYETLRSYSDGIAHMQRLFAVDPASMAHDLHPEYLSTKYAFDRAQQREPDEEKTLVGVQHHHAHLAAALAEYGERGPAIGAIFDGTGYGTDGDIWGGEILAGDLERFDRVAHLWPVRMPGGERAIREPWRMACAWLTELAAEEIPPTPRTLASAVSPSLWRSVSRLAQSTVASPRTTSMGRLFDAVAALCGISPYISYEGQAAIELEMLADPDESGSYSLPLLPSDGAHPAMLDGRVLIKQVLADLDAHVSLGQIAARTYYGVAYAAAQLCARVADERGLEIIVLSGGVFQNVLLIERTATLLIQRGFRVLVPQQLPLNDGGLSFGQAAIAAARSARLCV